MLASRLPLCIWILMQPLSFFILNTIYKMSDRSLSVYKDTSASHEYLCTLIKNGHEFCKLLLKRTEIVVQWNYIWKLNVRSLENCD